MSRIALSESVFKSSELIGKIVLNTANETLGKIVDVALYKNRGQVAYIVLAFGGFLGLGIKFFALPWNLLQYNSDKDIFLADIQNSPGFDKSEWPQSATTEWGVSVTSFYSQTAAQNKVRLPEM
jgi:sporulation protein YlmC with PRC-barrel domain